MNKAQLEYIKPSLIVPHPDAVDALEQTRTFRFQIGSDFIQQTLLGHGAFELPWVIANKDGSFQFFAGWKCLLTPFSVGLGDNPLPVLVFHSRNISQRITCLSWQYAFHLALSNLHEDSYLAHTAQLLRRCPVTCDLFGSVSGKVLTSSANLITEEIYGVKRRRVERQEAGILRSNRLEVNHED